MGFIDAYKHLEKLCGEILDDDRKLSAYIDEMINTPNGSYYVSNWDNDLKMLKHYRWVRNKIAHDPDCNENNMCEPEDEVWINNFYSRIMNQTDPLSLYRKSLRNKSLSKSNKTYDSYNSYENQNKSYRKQTEGYDYNIAFFIIAAIVIATILLALLSNN